MRKLMVLPALLLLVAVCSGIILETIFVPGATHFAAKIDGIAGAPIVNQQYFFTAVGVSTNENEAFGVSRADVTGEIVFKEIESRVGDCTWVAHFGEKVVGVDDLNGQSINKDEVITWSVAPNNSAVTVCRLEFDLNIHLPVV